MIDELIFRTQELKLRQLINFTINARSNSKLSNILNIGNANRNEKSKEHRGGEMFMNLRDISSFKAIQPQFIIKSKEKCKKGTTNK